MVWGYSSVLAQHKPGPRFTAQHWKKNLANLHESKHPFRYIQRRLLNGNNN